MMQKTRILVIENGRSLREIAAREFPLPDYECCTENSLPSALKQMEREPFHLAVLESGTPNADRMDALKRIRGIDPDIAVVIVVADGVPEYAPEAAKLGIFDFLTVPTETGMFVATVRSALEKRRLSLENRVMRENLDTLVEERTRRLDRANRHLQSSIDGLIKTFAGLQDKRAEFLGTHSKRVASACREICIRLDLRENIRRDIETGALLHDVGKIGIPDAILRKSANFFEIAKLSEKERKIIRLHPIVGQEAVEMVEALAPVSLIIRHHHELFNGSGYPDHLSGYNIPLGSRIITVADVYDTVVNCIDAAKRETVKRLILTHLLKNSGILYDPDVVDIFIDYIREKDKQISSRIERKIPLGDLREGMVLSRNLHTNGGVLLASQGEAVTHSDYVRVMRFRQRKAVPDIAYVFDSSGMATEASSPPAPDASALIAENKSATEVNRENIVKFMRVRDAIDKSQDLGTLPTVYQAAVSLLDDPASTRDDIANVLKQDQAIVAKVLRMVNSPLFAFSRRITSIEDAIPLLGFSEIRNIVTSVSVLSMFTAQDSSEIFDRNAFWKHSAACAIVCKILARKLKVAAEEEYFTAALLHDIGKLALDQLFPEDFSKVISLIKSESLSIRQAERTVFGRPHNVVGDYLLRKWKIPEILADSVMHHHSPKDGKIDTFLASTVCIADMIVHMLDIGSSGQRQTPDMDEFASAHLGIDRRDLDVFIPEIEEHIHQSDDILKLGD